MLLKLLIVAAMANISVASYGGSSYSGNGGVEYDTFSRGRHGYFHPKPWYHRKHHRGSDSDEKWKCPKVGVFNVTNALVAPLLSAPKIAYYTHQGKEKVIIVCEEPQVQQLFAKSPNATPLLPGEFKDIALISVSTKAGIVLTCDKRDETYDAYNLFTKTTVPVVAVACLGTDDATRASVVASLLHIAHNN